MYSLTEIQIIEMMKGHNHNHLYQFSEHFSLKMFFLTLMFVFYIYICKRGSKFLPVFKDKYYTCIMTFVCQLSVWERNSEEFRIFLLKQCIDVSVKMLILVVGLK